MSLFLYTKKRFQNKLNIISEEVSDTTNEYLFIYILNEYLYIQIPVSKTMTRDVK